MSGKLSDRTTKWGSSVDPIIASVTRTRHSYNTMVDDSFHDLDLEELFSTTPGLCNAPIGIVVLAVPVFWSKNPVDTRFSGHFFSLVAATRCDVVMDDDCSVDQIFELEL